MFDDLLVRLDPPPNRRGKCSGDQEHHLPEAAVMLAYAMHLVRTVPSLTTIELHPDGEHAKRFEIAQWLFARGFLLKERFGKTAYSGTYASDLATVIVTSRPGKGDVVGISNDGTIIAECKGGIVNTKHPGQNSRLRKELCEAVGQLMAGPATWRQVAVAPYTETTLRVSEKLARRARAIGIEIALVDPFGQITDIPGA